MPGDIAELHVVCGRPKPLWLGYFILFFWAPTAKHTHLTAPSRPWGGPSTLRFPQSPEKLEVCNFIDTDAPHQGLFSGMKRRRSEWWWSGHRWRRSSWRGEGVDFDSDRPPVRAPGLDLTRIPSFLRRIAWWCNDGQRRNHCHCANSSSSSFFEWMER